jgi:hypothetical protein
MSDNIQIDLEDWLSLFETHRPDYLSEARDVARKLLETRASITINDVRDICPPPRGIDPRVMGAVFRHKDFEATGEFVLSNRTTCHNRPIQRFALTNYAKVHAALGLKR